MDAYRSKRFGDLVRAKYPGGIENVPEMLGLTKNVFTRYVNNSDGHTYIPYDKEPQRLTIFEWSELLDVPVLELIWEYGAGAKTITLDQWCELVKRCGLKIEIDLVPQEQHTSLT